MHHKKCTKKNITLMIVAYAQVRGVGRDERKSNTAPNLTLFPRTSHDSSSDFIFFAYFLLPRPCLHLKLYTKNLYFALRTNERNFKSKPTQFSCMYIKKLVY